jgi:hypothetical protein
MMKDTWKRTLEQEIVLRCSMVRGTFLEDAADAVIALVGTERAKRQVPVSGATNIVRRMLSVTARLYERCAVSGCPEELALLCSDSSFPVWTKKLETIDARPIPTGLVEGGGKGGLRDMLQYLQTCGYCGVVIDWSGSAERPFIMVAEPDDLLPSDITYAPDDPLSPVGIRWRRERDVDGEKRIVYDTWDVSNPENPYFRVMLGSEDVTARVPTLRGSLGQLSGAGYWWRYANGRPFIPCVIYGSPSRVMEGISVTEAALDAVAFRTACKSAVIDAGFPTREVQGLTTGTDADDNAEGTNVNPGDVRVWRNTDETREGKYWQFSAAADPEAMFRTCQAMERDAVTQLGFPIELTATGGEPIAWEVEAQQRAISRWYNICRAGDSILFRRIAAVTNRQLGKSYPESGYSTMYDAEIVEALAASKPEEPQDPAYGPMDEE